MSKLPKVCLIGAGASGITTARSLSRRGIPFECFDRGDRVGGACRSSRDSSIGVSRERLEFADWPMPKSYPWFPRRSHLGDYLHDYAGRFGLQRHIRLGTAVTSARLDADGAWVVELGTGERRLFDALVVASGARSAPRAPAPLPPGEFAGEQLHAHDYRGDAALRGREVVVVGAGTTASDIAVEASYVARSTHLSMRRARYVLPLTVLGRPYDQLPCMRHLHGQGIGRGPVRLQLPWLVRQGLLTAAHRTWFSQRLHGLPQPERLMGAARATPAPHLMERLLHGRIGVKPEIERLDGDHVTFADGSRVRADTIVWCTGHRADLPFLPPDVTPLREDGVELFWNVFAPGVPNLAFVGLLDAVAGSLTQVAECQGRWVAAYLDGGYALPGAPGVRKEIQRRRRLADRRRAPSGQRAMQLEQFDYAWRLERERRAGRRRARRPNRTVA